MKRKLKLLWYNATDHRDRYTWASVMVLVVLVTGVPFVWLNTTIRIRFTICFTIFVVAILSLAYCAIGQVLFDRRVKGGKRTHDLS